MSQTKGQAANYALKELLLSRTDTRGVILSANEAFERVSGFALDELINAPHKIVRHPDMPKGIFWLLWDRIKKGDPIGAYVKNRTKDGGYYWVFATLSPLDGGYLSMRIKPSAMKIEEIEDLYSRMRSAEQDENLSPEQSASRLTALVSEHGYKNYDRFMADKLAGEIAARDAGIGKQPNARIKALEQVLEIWGDVGTDCDEVFDAYAEFGNTPMNMRIQAGHLKDDGIALGVIAANFDQIANQINHDLEEFAASVQAVTETIYDTLFLISVQALLVETKTVLAHEGATTETDLQIITQQSDAYAQKTNQGLQHVMSTLRDFLRGSEIIKRQLSGLSVTRVMCAIESAQINHSQGNSIASIIEELRQFQEEADLKMRSIGVRLTQINQNVNRLGKVA